MNRTGWVVALVALVVGSGVGIGALAHVAGQGTGTGGAQSAVVWIPENATVIGQVDVTGLSESAIAGMWLDAVSTRDAAQAIDELRARTGIDPRRDISRVTFSAMRTDAEPAAEAEAEAEAEADSESGAAYRRLPADRWGAVLEGIFDPDAIVQSVSEERETASEVYEGITLHLLADAAADDDADREVDVVVALAFPDASNLLLIGQPGYLRDMIAAGLGRTDSVASSPLMTAWESGGLGDDTFWLVGHPGDVSSLLDRTGTELPPLESFAVSGRLNQDLALRARGDASDATAAQQLADVARGFLALGRLNENTTEELKGLLDTVAIGQVDDKVEVTMTVPHDTLVRLLERSSSTADRD